jgi:hypothetical protein
MVLYPSFPWIYNYLCNQCLSPLTLWARITLMRGVLDTTLCDTICQWLAIGRWFSPSTPVSSTNKTQHFFYYHELILFCFLNKADTFSFESSSTLPGISEEIFGVTFSQIIPHSYQINYFYRLFIYVFPIIKKDELVSYGSVVVFCFCSVKWGERWWFVLFILIVTLQTFFSAHPSGAPEFTPVFNVARVTRSLVLYVCFVDRCLSFCTFSFDQCVVWSSSICGFWLPFWYLQTLLS